MLVKEYRVILPMTVDEYRIAQLYMIQKKSRLESGTGSGVEIIENKPYTDDDNISGQYTYKVFHIEERIPAWIRSIIPNKNALKAVEEAWNAYPVTKTKYSCHFLDRLSIVIETQYFDDCGVQENVFNLNEEDLKARVVDVMDFVNDPVTHSDFHEEEDPNLYVSKKTGRGPLSANWIKEGKTKLMCAYKLVTVEFRYWGMQTRVEGWIHTLIRQTMTRAHRQAWTWQDEWIGLTIEDIRRLEEQTKAHLSKVMSETNNEKGTEEHEWETSSASDTFYDCPDHFSSISINDKPSLVRWSSELMVAGSSESRTTDISKPSTSIDSSLLILIFHSHVFSDAMTELKASDADTFKSVIDLLITTHYPKLKGKVHVKRVNVGFALNPVIDKISKLCPHFGAYHPSLALLVMSYGMECYLEAMKEAVTQANKVYQEFLEENHSSGPNGFNGDIYTVGDCLSGLLLYGILAEDFKLHRNDSISMHRTPVSKHSDNKFSFKTKNQDIDQESIVSSWEVESSHEIFIRPEFAFHVNSTFLLGCPLALVLMQKNNEDNDMGKLKCDQLFNLYYPLDPCAVRIEPVLNSQLSMLPPVNVPRYQRFPLGDGKHFEFDVTTVECAMLWGAYRIDHQLFCPSDMKTLSSLSLPNILQASYWESKDVASFLLRQFAKSNDIPLIAMQNVDLRNNSSLILPKQQWTRRRTKYKIANLGANHRGNDVIYIQGKQEQTISAKFHYGPLDLVALSHERVGLFICTQGGEWHHLTNVLTDNHGRLNYTLDKSELLPIGKHQIKMVVLGDYTYMDMYVVVVLENSPFVIFSIDGALTQSVSITGRDPRVRPGAVDLVRYWQSLNYQIIYITARPDMQQKVVATWMNKHSFPWGLFFFNTCFSTDPLRQKTNQLRSLLEGLRAHAAYGSAKDVDVYCNANIGADRIFSITHKKSGCINIEDYGDHLRELQMKDLGDLSIQHATFARRSGKFGAVN
uniref:DDHD domain-containing protein n=1 Tax=Rhabditophanes sp. KR3021 TaxID=114890 RepID=A0AC35TN75_9BILA